MDVELLAVHLGIQILTEVLSSGSRKQVLSAVSQQFVWATFRIPIVRCWSRRRPACSPFVCWPKSTRRLKRRESGLLSELFPKWNCICFAWKTIITLASACAMQEFQFIQLWKYFMWANKNISFIEFHQSQCLSLCLWVLVLVFRLSGSSAYPKTFVLKALLQKAKSPVATKCHCWPSRRQVDTGYELHGCDIWYTQSSPTRKSFYLLKLSPVFWDYSISCMASLWKLFFCLLKWKFSTT